MPQVALITGGNRGIGLEAARQLGKAGYAVVIGARDVTKGVKAVAALADDGVNVKTVQLDVCDDASIRKAADLLNKEYPALDVLINCAGVLLDRDKPASAAPLDDWRQTFTANVIGLVAVTQAMLPLLMKSPAPRIVNVSSILGSLALTADPESDFGKWAGMNAAYCSSKAAVNMFTLHLARELAKTPAKVNAAHPGWVQTDMGGPDAPLPVEEGAKTLVELATLPENGPTGSFMHMGKTLPW